MDLDLLFSLGVALLLGLRHASDPDHLVAITSLVAGDDGHPRAAARVGALWGAGHALTLLAVGLPLVLAKSELPAALERGAERAVGVVIALLALRVLAKWLRGDYRADPHTHPPSPAHRHLRHAGRPHVHTPARSGRRAFAIGVLHGLAGTGAVVLLLLAALPSRGEAALALALFAPASAISMAACSAAFAWALTRRRVAPAARTVLIPALGAFSLLFGVSYAGL